jgi:general secretion pathway protein G
MDTMKSYRTTLRRGFTLVEILIVVIILGILAAIVIPQFTNASQDARKNSLTSQLQTIRSQLELYKMQHLDKNPDLLLLPAGTGTSTDWSQLTKKTDKFGVTTATTGLDFGPYLQQTPANPLNGFTTVAIGAVDVNGGDGVSGTSIGYIANVTNGKIWATSSKGKFVFNESDPSATLNDW